MGYESKVYIVSRCEWEHPDGQRSVYAIAEAEFDLSKMGYSNRDFFAAFKRPIDYTLWLPGCDEQGNEKMMEMTEDCYGEHMKAADLGELVEALTVAERREHYRRIPPLIAMLEAFIAEADEWNDGEHRLEAVHFGY